MTSKIVFIVDNEAVIADTLAVILRQSGFAAKSFHRTDEVLRATELVAPDLLISDVDMPGMTGVELAKRIRSKHPECMFLLFSRQADSRDKLRQAHGDSGFKILQKPIHRTDLLQLLAFIKESS